MKEIKIFFGYMLIGLLMVSCHKDAFWEQGNTSGSFQASSGIFVLNEGNFMRGNSSLCFINNQLDSINRDVFSTINQRPLGDVAQSMSLIHGNIWVVVNNSGKIEILDPLSMLSKAKIDGLISPRYITTINDSMACVSDLLSTKISLINTKTLRLTGQIECGKSTEQMMVFGNYLLALHWSDYGGFDNRSASLIDIPELKKSSEIILAKEPNSLVKDKNGDIWILCSGGYQGIENPQLIKLDGKSFGILRRINFEIGRSPKNLITNRSGDSLLYIDQDVFKMGIDAPDTPGTAFITRKNRLLYAMAIDPREGRLFISDALDYSRNGKVYIYSASGLLIQSLEAGIIPGNFLFYQK